MPIFILRNFQGLNEIMVPGEDPRFTRNLDNVKIRQGKIIGRGGLDELRDITTASSTTPIIGLMSYTGSTLNTTLVRITPTKVASLNTGTDVWDDITGTAFTAASTDRPQFTRHKGDLCFTVEGGGTRPRKWTGTGNTAVLGGTPPFCKAIESYYNFLLLGNTSTDGTTFAPRRIIASEDYDGATGWDSCNAITINFNETAGGILATKVFGREVIVYKSDALIQLRSVGSTVRFAHERIPFPHGILAPLSVQNAGDLGHIFLATDYALYITNGTEVKPLPPYVQVKLQETMVKASAIDCRSAIKASEDTYHLLYKSASGDTWFDSRISYNYRTGEFYHSSFAGHEFISLLGFRYDNTQDELLAASTTDLVFDLDNTDSTDAGTVVARVYDTDWLSFGTDDPKKLHRVKIVATKTTGARIKVSVAFDDIETFFYEKGFDLRGRPTEKDTIVEYTIPANCEARSFNLKIKMYHDSDDVQIKALVFEYDPIARHLDESIDRPSSPIG